MVDSRGRDRHLLDVITLLACITEPDSIIRDLRGSDRKRLTHILQAFEEGRLVAAQAPTDTVRLARRTSDDLRDALTARDRAR